MRSLACATYESAVQSKASPVVISRNNVSSMGEQKAYMGDTADRMLQHRPPPPNISRLHVRRAKLDVASQGQSLTPEALARHESMENLGMMPRRASPRPPWQVSYAGRGSFGFERCVNDEGPSTAVR